MDQLQLAILSRQINIAAEHIVREYYEMIILQKFSDTNLTEKMIFYGGTALRLAYNGMRFSEDLDFVWKKRVSLSELESILIEICRTYPELQMAEIYDKKYTLFGMIKFIHPSLKYPRHIKIEISKRKTKVKSEYRMLYSKCSAFSPLIQTITLESLLELKMQAIKERQEPRDWIDLWQIANMLRKPFVLPAPFPFEVKEFGKGLKRFLPRNKWLVIDTIINKIQKS